MPLRASRAAPSRPWLGASRKRATWADERIRVADRLLEIRDLHVNVGDKEIIRGIDLIVDRGTVHALMGPNGSGKSTLSLALMGNPKYTVTKGEIFFKGQNVLELPPNE